MLIVFCAVPAFCLYRPDMRYSGAGEVIPVGSRIYDLFDSLFILCGHTSPSTSRPWTVAEARSELSKIDQSFISSYALRLYDEISEAISEGNVFGISVDSSLNPEVYVHTNEDFCLEEDWNYGYVDRSPLAYVGLNAWHKGFGFHMELSYGQSKAGSSDTLISLRSYVEDVLGKQFSGAGSAEDEHGYYGDFGDIRVTSRSYVYGSGFVFNGTGPTDLEMPREAFLAYAWDGVSVGIYRGRKVWGRSKLGNFVYDAHVERYNYISLKTFNRKFSFDFTVMAPEAYLNGTSDTRDYGPVRRFFLSHRLEYQVRDNIKFTFSENVMYLATYFTDFQFMNPAFLYHNNINSGQFNALAHVEFEFAPFPGIQIYAQLGVDQGSVPFFEDSSKEDLAAGLTIGSQYVFLAFDGLMDLNLEAVYVTPAMYRRAAPDFIIATESRISENYLAIPTFTYIGFKYGGDTLGFRLDAGFRKDSVSLYAAQSVIFKGEFGLYDKYRPGMFTKDFLTGDVSVISITDIGAGYSFSAFGLFDCRAFADVCLISAGNAFDLQIALGLKTNYGTR